MTTFVVRPLSREITSEVRSSRRAPRYGHPVHEELASGTGPCRECLGAFTLGAENRLLFTYSPFHGEAVLPQPGPVFIHADACEPHHGAGYPAGLRDIPAVAQAYKADGTVGSPRALSPGDEAATIELLLGDPAVRFLHLRHAEAGCFIARVERAAGGLAH